MVQAGEDLGFPLEPGQPLRIAGERLGQDLQGDIAVELRVSGAIDLPYPTFPDESRHVVVPEPVTDV